MAVAMRRTVAVLMSGLLAASGGVFVATEASAAPTTIRSVTWSKPRVDVASKIKYSTLKVRVADGDGVCSVWVKIARKGGGSFSGLVDFGYGSSTDGTWTARIPWYLETRGTWRVTAINVVDCDGHVYFQKRSSGIGQKLVVFSSKKISRVSLSSVPRSLLRGTWDTAIVKLRAGTKKIKRAAVRLRACDDDSYTDCWNIGKARTNSKGVAKVRYRMPRQDMVVFAVFRGNKTYTYGYSRDREVRVRWKDIAVGMKLTFNPGVAVDWSGEVTATVRFDRTVCSGVVTLSGSTTYEYEYIDSCTSSISFEVSEPNFGAEPVTESMSATLEDDGYGEGDTFHGRSNVASFVVPGDLY